MVVALGVVVLSGLVLRAVTVHSVGNAPLIYRVTTNNNDLDSVEGVAAPGRLVELWYRQRNFREGIAPADPGQDPFSWCSWKNGGTPVQIGSAWTDSRGVWHIANLRQRTTVMVFPSAAGDRTCQGGVYTELLPRACDWPGANCSAWSPPSMHWLNVKTLGPVFTRCAMSCGCRSTDPDGDMAGGSAGFEGRGGYRRSSTTTRASASPCPRPRRRVPPVLATCGVFPRRVAQTARRARLSRRGPA
jgi:hypothetical protein